MGLGNAYVFGLLALWGFFGELSAINCRRVGGGRPGEESRR